MKTTVRLLTVMVGVAVMLTAVGCPKKCVKPEEPIPPPPPPDTMPPIMETPTYGFDLATIHFDFDMSKIRAGDGDILKGNADQLKEAAGMELTPNVMIEGHCDPIGTSEYNMALGQRRAESAKAYLVKLGVPADQLGTISYGEEQLVTQTPDDYEMNRRCEFKVEE